MTIFLWLLLTLLVFFIVVFLHELGHFSTARWSGVKVLEFGIWIPPKLKKIFTDRFGTDWTLNWLPLGGFVRLKGENYADPDSADHDAFSKAKWWKQVIILLAWVIMNFILAGWIFSYLFYAWTEPLVIHIREFQPHSLLSHVWSGTKMIPIFDTLEQAIDAWSIVQNPGIIVNPLAGSPAIKAWLVSWDIILTVDTIPISEPVDLSKALESGKNLEIDVLRWAEKIRMTVEPISNKIWAYIQPNIVPNFYKLSPWESLLAWFQEVGDQVGFSLRTFGTIISTSFSKTSTEEQKKEATAGIWWPVAIGKVFVWLAENGIDIHSILILTALISLSLWVFNLLPFPALDGGRCLIVLVNQAIHIINPRYKISPRIEQAIHSLGFLILIVLSVLVTWKDIFGK